MHFTNIWLIVGNAIGTRERSRVIIDATVGIKYHTEPGRQEWVTAIECICADGTVLPPYVIFKGMNIMTNWITSKNTAQWRFACNSKVWTSNEVGVDWLKLHFEPLTRNKANGGGRVLICDGHDSHISAAFVRHCMANNIWILLLPPHSSHLLQPLDVGIFGPLEKAISVESDKIFRTGASRIQKVRWLEGMAKRKENMSAKRHVLKGQISICSEENMEKLEAAEAATKKRKAGQGLSKRGGKRQKQAQPHTADTNEA